MMQNMSLQEGDMVQIKNTSLVKGTYIKLQPHTQDFLDISNPKAMFVVSKLNYFSLFFKLLNLLLTRFLKNLSFLHS